MAAREIRGTVLSLLSNLNYEVRVAYFGCLFSTIRSSMNRIHSIMCYSSSGSLFWPLSGVGIYWVKSGYKLLCEDSREASALGFSLVRKDNFWFGLWNLKVLEKIEHFMWKACTNNLPTKVILLKRKILMD